MTRYLFYRRLVGPLGLCGKVSFLPEFDPRTAKSYRLCYPGEQTVACHKCALIRIDSWGRVGEVSVKLHFDTFHRPEKFTFSTYLISTCFEFKKMEALRSASKCNTIPAKQHDLPNNIVENNKILKILTYKLNPTT
jgi:hypothetical protein